MMAHSFANLLEEFSIYFGSAAADVNWKNQFVAGHIVEL